MPSCFVIMPFGERKGPDGKDIDFDEIYDCIIKPSVTQIEELTCIRCDEIEEAGTIHKTMLEQIHQADVAVVDITTSNPNVFYELGVRHTLANRITVIIKREGTEVPFNIKGLNTIEYDTTSPRRVIETKEEIVNFIRNGLKTRKIDSLVHEWLPTIRIPPESKLIRNKKKYMAALAVPGKQIGIITGELRGIKDVDVWVNSENTNMQMARFYERSVSGTIRYYGAKRNQAGHVIDDILANELEAIVGKNAYVSAATVIATSAGQLQASNNVKRIFHAAAVNGQIGIGFMPINNVDVCIENALTLADSDEQKGANLRSILFPLMGTGQGGGKLQETVNSLIATAVSYLENKPDSVIEQVYFLCLTEGDLWACQWAFEQAGLKLKPA